MADRIPSIARIALPLVATAALALAQPGHAQSPAPAANAACPKAHDATAPQLYGLWRATFEGAPPATLLLDRHPEYDGGLRGGVNRGGVQGLVAGDVDDGELNLDESADGIRISASWSGTIVEDSCAKEITGVWTPETGKPLAFVLRRLPD